MKLPDNELKRLETLFKLKIIDTDDEEVYNVITKLAASIMEAPIAMMTFIDEDTSYVKARFGTEAKSGPREPSFCTHTILDSSGSTLVKDATLDKRFANNPYVIGEPKIRFYFGTPLVMNNQEAVGTLCVVDNVARKEPNAFQYEAIHSLSKLIVVHLEMRQFVFDFYEGFEKLKMADLAVSKSIQGKYKELNERCDMVLGKIKAKRK